MAFSLHKFGFIIKILFFSAALLAQADDPEHRSKGLSEPISVKAGSDAVLPCHVNPSLDVSMMTVEWKRGTVTVHVRREGADDDNDPKFKGRTHLFDQELAKGNMSLIISNMTKQDEGTYTCILWKDKKPIKVTVQLKIVESMNTDEQGGGDDKKGNKDWSPGKIAGTVFGVLGFLALIGGVLGALKRKGKLPCFRQNGREGKPYELQQMNQRRPPSSGQDPPAPEEEENPFVPQQIRPDDARE